MPVSRPEILAPAGDMTCLQAALDAGADAVYLGLGELNMRRMATRNFSRETLPEAAARCRAKGVRLYLTLNSLLFEGEVAQAESILRFAKPYVDAVIVADWAVVALCRRLGIPFHISTQLSCANAEAARFLKAQGASRVVLARECTLEEVAAIARTVDIEIEAFVHGAVCVAVSGRCLLSHDAYGCSSNRGECHQPCRREFLIREVREGEGADAAFRVTPHTVLSARDLCSLPFVDRLMAAGIASFKIEGRARNPEYVKAVVSAYREAVDAVAAGRFSQPLAETLVARCAKVYHREFGCGLYYGRPGVGQFTDTDANQATEKKLYVGIVLNYYPQARVAQVLVHDRALAVGDAVSIHGPTSGVVDLRITALRQDERTLERVERGEWVTFPCAERVRVNDKVYAVVPADDAR
ncbi:MAG: U32 family peptidase [Kiritimatiellae bacterium]|nr:U32 family peptidase [Kiritimatiellia bacterium]